MDKIKLPVPIMSHLTPQDMQRTNLSEALEAAARYRDGPAELLWRRAVEDRYAADAEAVRPRWRWS